MNLEKLARKLNRKLFDNRLNLSAISFHTEKEFLGTEGIAGITLAFKTTKGNRISVVYLFSKYCKGKHFITRVLAHELVHCYQNQLKQKQNHNGAFFNYYERKARSIGYEIDMQRF